MNFDTLPSILTPELGLLFWMLLAFLVVYFVLSRKGFPALLQWSTSAASTSTKV